MRNTRRFGAVVLMAAFVTLPMGDAWAQKGKKEVPLPTDKADSSKLAAGKYVGVVKSAPNGDRSFDVELPVGKGKNVLVEFQLTENAKVRTLVLPEAFDDKGNPKKYSKKELDELKGADRTLPGYESAAEKIGAGQTVQLTLVAAPRPAGGKKKDGDGDGLKSSVDKTKQVRLVVIASVPEGSEGGGPAVKKKK